METVPIGEAERLGNAVNALPVEVDRGAGNVIRMPAWPSFVFALVANPERAARSRNDDRVTAHTTPPPSPPSPCGYERSTLSGFAVCPIDG